MPSSQTIKAPAGISSSPNHTKLNSKVKIKNSQSPQPSLKNRLRMRPWRSQMVVLWETSRLSKSKLTSSSLVISQKLLQLSKPSHRKWNKLKSPHLQAQASQRQTWVNSLTQARHHQLQILCSLAINHRLRINKTLMLASYQVPKLMKPWNQMIKVLNQSSAMMDSE